MTALFVAAGKGQRSVEQEKGAHCHRTARRSGFVVVEVDSTVSSIGRLGPALLVLQPYARIRWITGFWTSCGAGGPTDPPTYMTAFLTFNGILMCVGLPIAICGSIVQALASGAAENHARRHADESVHGPDVLPGPTAQLLQHLVHLQRPAPEPRLLVIRHSRMGVTRGTGSPGRSTASDHKRSGKHGLVYWSFTIFGCWVMRQDQGALAQHQQSPD